MSCTFLIYRLCLTSPPRMRHSLIYNYLREHAVLMLQNAYKHPCSKHLITIGKGTHFFSNKDKKTNKNTSKGEIFNKSVPHFPILAVRFGWLSRFKCCL